MSQRNTINFRTIISVIVVVRLSVARYAKNACTNCVHRGEDCSFTTCLLLAYLVFIIIIIIIITRTGKSIQVRRN